MAYKTFVDGVDLPASDLQTYLMNQSVIVCTSSTRPSSPNEGMVIYETDTDSLKVYTTATTGWRPQWNLPWGYQGHGSTTSNQGSLTGTADLTGLSVTFTAVTNRRYAAWVHTNFEATSNGNVAAVTLLAGATVVSYGQRQIDTAGQLQTLDLFGNFTAPAGSLTVKVQGGMASGSGSVTSRADATDPARLLVMDIGPSTAPA